ncbi:chaperone protein htpG [Thermus thermophilus]|nr:chaperone protein htpG [Thermus thermophilus]
MRRRNRWLKTLFWGSVLGVFLALVLVFSGVAVGALEQREGRPVPQPVPFNHAFHAGGLGLSCRYCHSAVEYAPYAGLPPTETCMTCHLYVKPDSPNLALVRESWEKGEPLRWNRVINLPDFVYFHHAPHVAKGVGCAECHGRVDQMPVVYQPQAFTMKFCLDCHRNPAPHLRPREQVFNMAYVPDPELGRELLKLYHVRPPRSSRAATPATAREEVCAEDPRRRWSERFSGRSFPSVP